MNKRILALVTAGACAVAGVAYWRMHKGDEEPVDEKLVITLKKQPLRVEVADTGIINPRERVSVKSRVAGEVQEVLVDEGDTVEKGQLLLKLDPTEARRDLARAEAELARAENTLAYAGQSLARRRRALDGLASTPADVEAAEHEERAQQAGLRAAKVAVASARDRLAYCEVRAPMAGTIITRGIEPGEVVTPGVQATFEGKPLLVIADLNVLLVRAQLNQIDVAKVALGQTVKLTLDALPDRTWDATVTKIAPASETDKVRETEVFPIEATLAAADPAVKPGMTADIRILVEEKPDVLTLPIEAVRKESDKRMVTKLATAGTETNKREMTEVQVGKSNESAIEITGGLKEGDRVLIDPGSSDKNEMRL